MQAPSYKKWLARLPALNGPQRLQTLAALHPHADLDRIAALIDQIRAPTRACPSCAGTRHYRYGHANGLQRYRCRACGRTFNDLTGTPLARLRMREKWPDYVDALRAAISVRKAAASVGVHRNTAFRWRHRFPDRVKHDLPQSLSGIVADDDGVIPEPQEGARKPGRQVTARKSSGDLPDLP